MCPSFMTSTALGATCSLIHAPVSICSSSSSTLYCPYSRITIMNPVSVAFASTHGPSSARAMETTRPVHTEAAGRLPRRGPELLPTAARTSSVFLASTAATSTGAATPTSLSCAGYSSRGSAAEPQELYSAWP